MKKKKINASVDTFASAVASNIGRQKNKTVKSRPVFTESYNITFNLYYRKPSFKFIPDILIPYIPYAAVSLQVLKGNGNFETVRKRYQVCALIRANVIKVENEYIEVAKKYYENNTVNIWQ